MFHNHTSYANGNGKHAYEIVALRGPTKTKFTVHANNRDQAARRVERDGYIVCDVNMVG